MLARRCTVSSMLLQQGAHRKHGQVLLCKRVRAKLLLLCAEAELARQRAEAEAQDKSNRLRVAQEQLCEWAAQKEADALDLLRAAEQAAAAATAASAAGSNEALLQQVQALRNMVAEAAAEAKAFAAQQKADVESLKRSSRQVGGHAHSLLGATGMFKSRDSCCQVVWAWRPTNAAP